MTIVVRGMKMPKNCGECYLSARTSLPSGTVTRCRLGGVVGTPIEESNKRHPDCPLVALPDKHGRLGDLDALCEDLLERWSVAETRKEELIKAVMADVVTPIIACQPTIVEAEK